MIDSVFIHFRVDISLAYVLKEEETCEMELQRGLEVYSSRKMGDQALSLNIKDESTHNMSNK